MVEIHRSEGLLIDGRKGVWHQIECNNVPYFGWATTQALEAFAINRKMPQTDLRLLYRTFEAPLLDIASTKIRAGALEPDGTFVITDRDVAEALVRYRVEPVA